MWASNGLLDTLQVGDVMADSGPLSVGATSINVISWTDDSPVLSVERRNALNTATLQAFRYQPNVLTYFTINFVLLLNERIRVIVELPGFIGSTQVTLMSQ